ncbi:DNA topoisomerase IB [Jatrophihabitans sp. YIM 134969]
MPTTVTADVIAELHDDPRRCAEIARLTYIETDHAAGWGRTRAGKGWRYTDTRGKTLTSDATKERLAALAIPPAWKDVWICPDPDGHILATGHDERGRKQYIYHPRWRELRDILNFYRLLVFTGHLGAIREHVTRQLRRRTLDRDQVLAVMIAVLDASYIRIGNEVYAEENHSFGLSTLTDAHVRVHGDKSDWKFPAKSGKFWDVTITDARIARKMQRLLDAVEPGHRLFAVDGHSVDSEDVNEVLRSVTGEHLTAKDFRTWGGTLAAFTYLRDHLDSTRPTKKIVNEALDEAAHELGNTRSVAKAHYVHPDVVAAFAHERFRTYLDESNAKPNKYLDPTERQLTGFLEVLLDAEFAALQNRDTGV